MVDCHGQSQTWVGFGRRRGGGPKFRFLIGEGVDGQEWTVREVECKERGKEYAWWGLSLD